MGTMASNRSDYDRRTVLTATAGTVAALGGSGLAAGGSLCPEPEFSVGDPVITDGTDGTAVGYDACTDPELRYSVENGLCGDVRDRCCENDRWFYYVYLDDLDRSIWFPESELGVCYSTN